MIYKVIDIPITKDSYPFASASKYIDLKKYEYEEKEFYVNGTANVYKTVGDNGEVEIKNKDVEYLNRIIVRAPKNRKKSSGNVVVEIINPTSFMEIDRMWILGYEKLMRDGDIYVGITSKPNTIAKLVEFDEKRYGCLSWPNPTKNIPFSFTSEDCNKKRLLPDLNINYETGLFWDMLTDLAWLLRGNNTQNPISNYNHSRIYLSGWSQSACYLFRYVNSFAYRDEVKKDARVFDGYLAGGGVRNLITPVNQYESLMDYNFKLNRIEHIEEPYISVQTESENGHFNAFQTKRNDSDLPNFMYREYEVTGASHDTMYSYVEYYKEDEDLKRINHLPTFNGKEEHGNDYPSQILFAAAFRNLFKWVEEGIGPRRCPRIEMDEHGNNLKDLFGNTKGGLRTCLLNYPTGVFDSVSTVEVGKSFLDPTSDKNPLFGYQKGFSSSFLKELYGSLENYKKLCIEDTKIQVSKGFVCKQDADKLVEWAVDLARERGLK